MTSGHDSGRLPAGSLLEALHRYGRCDFGRFLPWFCGGRRIGWMLPGFAELLRKFDTVFRVETDGVHLRDHSQDPVERTRAVDGVVRQICDRPGFGRWNGEYGLVSASDGSPVMQLARCATQPFGVRSAGAHVNGYVRTAAAPLLWVSVRHGRNSDYGGLLDTLAGGYITVGADPRTVAEREAMEEADIGEPMLRHLVATGTLRGCREHLHGVTPYAAHGFDLELPADFQPVNRDGEVEAFLLMGPTDLLAALQAGRFKFNAAAAIVDWLLRQGLVAPDSAAFSALPDALRTWDPD